MSACQPPPSTLPDRLSAPQFGQFIEEISEESGNFESDNLISNETAYLQVVDHLRRCERDQVYLGVGPEQNFSYIAALQPRLAFIVDIRRDNLLEHLLFKAIFELAPTPREYLEKLLCRKIQGGPSEWVRQLQSARPDEELFQTNLAAIQGLIANYGARLERPDNDKIEKLYRTFFEQGLDLRYEVHNPESGDRVYPSLREVLLSDPEQSFLGQDAAYALIRKMQQENRIIPVVGDFAGGKALRAIASYVRKHNAKVSAFYLSNVEYYLLPDQELDDVYEEFLGNLRALPRKSRTVLIRSWLNDPKNHPQKTGQHLFTTVAQPLQLFLRRVEENRYTTYQDILFDAGR